MKATRRTLANRERELKERIKSKDASRIEKAKAKKQLLELKRSTSGSGYSVTDLARELGESKSVTSDDINFAKETEELEQFNTSAAKSDHRWIFEEYSKLRLMSEGEIRRRMKEVLLAIAPDREVDEDCYAWPDIGIKVDLLQTGPNKEVHIYEVKKRRLAAPSPMDVYQLVMYWDGLVEGGYWPKLGTLLAMQKSEKVDRLIKYWNTRKDKKGRRYNLVVFTFLEFLREGRGALDRQKSVSG